MSTARAVSHRALSFGWRVSRKISPTKLAEYILLLERACQVNPRSVDLLTCLGIALGKNFHSPRAIETFQTAIQIDRTHFFARFHYAELLLSLHHLDSALEESLHANELAGRIWESSMARRQVQGIERLIRESLQ